MNVFFFNDTATTEIYTLSLHDALPILGRHRRRGAGGAEDLPPRQAAVSRRRSARDPAPHRSPRQPLRRPLGRSAEARRSEEHTSELQSRQYFVCRLLLEKKKNNSPPSK